MLTTHKAVLVRSSAVLIAMTTLTASGVETGNVLTLVPEETLGFAVVNELADVNEKLGKYAQELELPLPDLLTLAKATAGIEQGLDDGGTVLAAMVSSVDGSDEIEDSEVLVALPVSDYKLFAEQFGSDASSEISELKVAGLPMLMAHKSGYAVLVPSDSEHRALLKKVVGRDASVPAEIAELGEWIADNDAAVVVLSPGITLLADKAIVALEKVKKQFSEMEELGDQAGQVAAAFEMYLQMLRAVKAEVHTAADGLRIDDAGNIRLGGRVRFTETGQLTKISDASNRTAEDLLAGLPGGPYVGAVGASLSPECGELVARWSIAVMKNNPALYGMKLSDEAADRYLELTLTSMKELRGLSMMMRPVREGESILDGMLGIFSTDNAKDYLVKYEQMMGQFQDLIQETDSQFPYEMDVSRAEIAGVEGLKVVIDMSAALAAQGGPPEATQMLEKMLGRDGEMTAHILALDKTNVLISYGSETAIERLTAALKSGAPGLAREASIEQARALLPKEAGLVAYLSPRGAVAWFKNIATHFVPPEALEQIPEFPETPAIVFSATMVEGGLETEMVVPAEFPPAVKEYVERVLR